MAVFQKILSKDKIRDPKTKRLIRTSQERYRDTATGRIVSRRQRDKIAKAVPKDNRIRARANFNSLRDSYIRKQKSKGVTLSPRQAALSDELTKIIKDLERGKKLKKQGKIEEGNTLIRRALQRTDRRDGIARDVIPGESPKAGIAE